MKRTTLLAGIALIACVPSAHAQSAGAQAEVLFRQGRDLLTAGKIAEACTAFAGSQKLEPAVTTLVNLAGCREKQGQLATAWGLFLEAERQTRSATDVATQQLHGVAQDHAQKLEPRVSKLTINVPQKSQLDGLDVLRGKDRVDSVMWNRALPIDGGTYTITAHSPGANAWSTEVTVAAEGDTKTVEIPDLRNLPRDLGQPTVAKPPVLAVTQSPESPHPSSKLVPLAVGAGALALLGGALGFDLWGYSTYNDAKAEMTDQARRDSLYGSANTKHYVAEGLAVAGVGCAGLAVWLYLRHHDDESPTATARLVVMPTGIAVMGVF